MFKQQETSNKDENIVNEQNGTIAPTDNKLVEEPKNPDDIDLNATFDYNDDHMQDIETARQAFLELTKKQNIIKWIAAGVSIFLLIFSWMYLIANNVQKELGYGLTALSVAILIAYYVITKSYNNKRMEAYLKRYYGDVNAFVFGQDGFTEVHGDVQGTIPNSDFNNSTLYKNVFTLGSRNVVNFKIAGQYECKICDCAAQMSTPRQLEPLFIGKYLIAPNKYQGDDPIIVYLTGNSRALPPNNVEQLPKVVNTRKMIIYSNNQNYESVLTSDVRQAIAKLVTNNVLVDVSIAVTKGFTYFGLGYDDCIMVLPLQTKFNPKPTEKFKNDLKIISEIVVGLNK